MPYLAILGNTPELSALELGKPWLGGRIAVCERLPDFSRLGGTVKVAAACRTSPSEPRFGFSSENRPLLLEAESPSDTKLSASPQLPLGKIRQPPASVFITDKNLRACFRRSSLQKTNSLRHQGHHDPLEKLDGLYKNLERLVAHGKVSFGFSVYAGDATISIKEVQRTAKELWRLGLEWKKKLRQQGHSVRFVVSREPELSSVIVTREHLLEHQTDFVVALTATHTLLGRTIAVQEYKAFSQRDYGRPQRDHRAGMLPPKVARMMVNIAKPTPTSTLLDPFCGSGTIVQEALSLGLRHVIGSDISTRAITDTKTNLQWAKFSLPRLYVSDVLHLPKILPPLSIDCVVTEGYLGPVLPKQIDRIQEELTAFYQRVFAALPKILKPNATLVVALPAWRQGNGLCTLNLQRSLQKHNYSSFHCPIFYGREHAIVLRQILFLRSAH